MARIAKLTAVGFKSFANKTEIPFYSGFNAVIGPNGSGKSNIVDALVFVLGKGSRSMRAQRMEHIIYNGGHGRRPADTAEVELVIDNSDRAIDIDEDVITISRKVNRRGVSYYKINGKTDKRENIQAILDKIGLDTDGMSIIQQGDITRVIEMRHKERRAIIDNAAGVKEYNEKKEKSLMELERAEKNISEANIILEQKKELLDKIRKERNAALKVKELTDRQAVLRAQLAYTKLKVVETEFENVKRNLKIKEDEYNALKSNINKFDDLLDKKEEEIKKLEDEMISKSINKNLRKDIEEITKKIMEKESKINVNRKEIETIEEMISKLLSISQSQGSSNTSLSRLDGVIDYDGAISDLITVDSKFQTAIEIAAGNHLNDVVVDSEKRAIEGIRYLKENKLGRMRFIPLDRIGKHIRSGKAELASKMPGIIGFASELVQYNPKYKSAIEYVFRDTLIAEDVDSAKKIKGIKVVTLDGELFEASGAIVGGSHKKRGSLATVNTSEIKEYERRKSILQEEIDKLKNEIGDLNELLESKRAAEDNESNEVKDIQRKRELVEEELDKIRTERKSAYESMINLEVEVRNLQIKKARLEAEFETYSQDFEKYKDNKDLEKGDVEKIEKELKRIEVFLRNAGLVNMKAIEEYEYYEEDYNNFLKRIEKLQDERKTILNMIDQIEEKRKFLFNHAFEKINEYFGKIFLEVADGEARLELEEEGNIDSGLIIRAQPKGKKLLSIDSLSGGEKAITALSFLFAIQHFRPSPFYLLDEVDAALDKTNSEKVGEMIMKNLEKSQFIVISHNDATVKHAERVYGVTMQKGVSQVFGVKLSDDGEFIRA